MIPGRVDRVSLSLIDKSVVGKTRLVPGSIGNVVDIREQIIEFSTYQGIQHKNYFSLQAYLNTILDAMYICAVSEAVEEYLLHCNWSENEFETIQPLILLFSVKNNFKSVVERLLGGHQPLAEETFLAEGSNLAEKHPNYLFWQAARRVAIRSIQTANPSELFSQLTKKSTS